MTNFSPALSRVGVSWANGGVGPFIRVNGFIKVVGNQTLNKFAVSSAIFDDVDVSECSCGILACICFGIHIFALLSLKQV